MSVIAMLGGTQETVEAHISSAIEITRLLKSDLEALLVMPDPAHAVMLISSPETAYSGGTMMSALAEAQEETLKIYRDQFDKAIAASGDGLKASFVHKTGSIIDMGLAEALLADSFVFPRGIAHSSHPLNACFEHVLMEARLPVVFASSTGKVEGPALIAWDGSPQAARAVRAHLPLIRACGAAIIAQQPDKVEGHRDATEAASCERLADWLHGERVTTSVAHFQGPVSSGLMALAEEHKAGVVVMGAYGHSRLSEALFGGTSRTILNDSEGPALAVCH